nr:site-specific integrase [Parabacteroides goldsteinii]
MYNVSVKIKRRKSVEEGKRMPLYMQFIYRREVRKILLPYKVSEDEWNKTGEEIGIRIPGNVGRERVEELCLIREQLNRDSRTVYSVVRSMESKNRFSLDDVVEACRERFSVSGFRKYVESLIGKLNNEGRQETARHYRSTLNVFMRFRHNCDLRLDEITASVLKEFETYLFGCGLCPNTVSFYLRIFRTIRNQAAKDGLVEADPTLFDNVHTRIEKTRKRAVEERVIKNLSVLDLCLSPELSLARDLFLFCYYARGMAFVDLAHLTRDNLKGNKIVYTRQKTGQQLQIHLLPVMRKLIARYQGVSGPYLFPVLKSMVSSYLDYTSALRLQNKRLKKLGKLVGADLSTYVAKHNAFAI